MLVDIGASGGVPELWKPISAYCHCLAFDADKRDVGILETQDSGFRSLKVVPRVVTAGDETTLPFFLTESPHCSSSLTPQSDRLRSYSFASAFNVVKKLTCRLFLSPPR